LVHATEKGLPRIPKRLVSLANQTLINLGLPLDKGPVRSSDWSRPMTPAQLRCKSPHLRSPLLTLPG
jgi:hypothetical protein